MGYRLKNIKDWPEKAFGFFMDYNRPVRLGRKGSLKTPSSKIWTFLNWLDNQAKLLLTNNNIIVIDIATKR